MATTRWPRGTALSVSRVVAGKPNGRELFARLTMQEKERGRAHEGTDDRARLQARAGRHLPSPERAPLDLRLPRPDNPRPRLRQRVPAPLRPKHKLEPLSPRAWVPRRPRRVDRRIGRIEVGVPRAEEPAEGAVERLHGRDGLLAVPDRARVVQRVEAVRAWAVREEALVGVGSEGAREPVGRAAVRRAAQGQ